MKQFNLRQHLEMLIEQVKRQQPRSWIEAVIKQSRLATLNEKLGGTCTETNTNNKISKR